MYKRGRVADCWPIDESASGQPDGWSGWPGGKKFALVLTHDVDTGGGFGKCQDLANLEIELGFRSSFNFVPERYEVETKTLECLRKNNFEIGVHGLNHDGKLYNSEEIFESRAVKINQYLDAWGAEGFRSPAMHHNLDWLRKLNITYDASTFDTDPFEPQSDGVKTIFPFIVFENSGLISYVELPYTLPQDFTLFVLLREKGPLTWKKKLDWLVEKGGMALLNTHPDYMSFGESPCGYEEYPAKYYEAFLQHIENNYAGEYWPALPKEVAKYWSSRQAV